MSDAPEEIFISYKRERRHATEHLAKRCPWSPYRNPRRAGRRPRRGASVGALPFALIVPCHRALAAGGRLGGFSVEGGISTKRRLLAIEGAWGKGAFAMSAASPGNQRRRLM